MAEQEDGRLVRMKTITPSEAKKILARSEDRQVRRIKPNVKARYVQEMLNGGWEANGASISFDRAGKLVDGFHRLSALIEADVSIRFPTVHNVETVDNVDINDRRRLDQLLAKRGESNYARLATLLYSVYSYKKAGSYTDMKMLRPAHSVMLTYLSKLGNPARRAAKLMVRFNSSRMRVPHTLTAILLYEMFVRYGSHVAEQWVSQAALGTNLAREHPICQLRNRLLTGRRALELGATERAALTVKTFNAWIRGEEMVRLKWTAQGSRAEPFPEIDFPEPGDVSV